MRCKSQHHHFLREQRLTSYHYTADADSSTSQTDELPSLISEYTIKCSRKNSLVNDNRETKCCLGFSVVSGILKNYANPLSIKQFINNNNHLQLMNCMTPTSGDSPDMLIVNLGQKHNAYTKEVVSSQWVYLHSVSS